MLLRKTLAFADCQIHIKAEGAAVQFGGYASLFGGNDTYNDTILPGAFADSLKQHGLPRMFYGHKWDLPIGKYLSVKEDDKGLWVEGEITPGMSRANDLVAALKHQTLDGLSVGGFVKAPDYEAKASGGRLIRKWTRLVEVSPVVFLPMAPPESTSPASRAKTSPKPSPYVQVPEPRAQLQHQRVRKVGKARRQLPRHRTDPDSD